MKTFIKNLILLPALIAGLDLMPTGPVTAQTFTTLRSFNSDIGGTYPRAGLMLSGSTLYGSAEAGSISVYSGYGTLFKVNWEV